jgi:hypothetical protein
LLAESGAATLVTTPADPPMKSFVTQMDDVGAEIMRRGVLACSSPTACTFTLVPTDDAEPVK